MVPAKPPLPMPRNRPFQFVDGIHTSIAIDESALGDATACTRQNAGSDFNIVAACGGAPSGGGNAPAATIAADVIFTFSNASFDSDSHVCVSCPAANGDSATSSSRQV